MAIKFEWYEAQQAGFLVHSASDEDEVRFRHDLMWEFGTYGAAQVDRSEGVEGAIIPFDVQNAALPIDDLQAIRQAVDENLANNGIAAQGEFEYVLFFLKGRDDVVFVSVRDVFKALPGFGG